MIQRHLESLILESLTDFPVVLVTGARQVGKSTLVQALCRRAWKASYLTLDDRTLLDAALTDPDGLLAAQSGPVAIDEVQHAPDLLRAVKLQVDRHRQPGRFLLTGSANVLTLKHVSETLAGRIALHQLHPFSYAELHRQGRPSTVLHRLFAVSDPSAFLQELSKTKARSSQALLPQMLHGGYPTPALAEKASVRTQWFEAYRKTYIERDILELQTIERLPEFSRLMLLAAARTGQILNFADLGRDAGLPYVTLRRYMQLLEQTYQVTLVPPYFANVSKQLAKAPKLYWNDTGMAAHLLGIHDVEALSRHPKLGALVETWVAQELMKLLALSPEPMRLYGWRLQSGPEVDFLIERGDRLLAIEVKWGRQLDPSVLRSVRWLQGQLGRRLILSIVLYGGEDVLALGPQLVAVPYDVFFRGRLDIGST
jgi:predicted AAA+ superfamily ATPase